ncbi:unnamed protein product, partial [Mesorhabditis belari]|uniref:HEAT repeat-containing protein 1 n=1 Tax=Mesorhabditis belari TaxID=2138241 RepID=A0AAF3FHA3_9BILA
MTSLARQLEALRGPSAQHLTAEKRHVSLLFEREEAEKLDRETVHKIGIKGLAELKKLDKCLSELDPLFDEGNINFQRVLITKAENEELSEKLQKALVLLSPYMQIFSCQQALELLVYRYQIYAFDAEFFLTSFLPFHETNFFGRILSTLELNYATNKEFAFLEQFAKKRYPVPFKMIAKNSASGSNALLTRITTYIDTATKLVGSDWLENHGTALFSLQAKVLLSLLDYTPAINDNLLSKVIPIVANGLKSHISSLRCAAMMTICRLVVSIKLTEATVTTLLKIMLLKMKDKEVASLLSTIIVVCQQQVVESLSSKGVSKILRRDDDLQFFSILAQLGQKTDLQRFLTPLWKTLLGLLESDDEEVKTLAGAGLLKSIDVVSSGEQMATLLGLIADMYTRGLTLPKTLAASLYSLCARYPIELDFVRKEWETRNAPAFEKLTELCNLQPLFLQTAKVEKIKRRRRSSRNSVSELTADVLIADVKPDPKDVLKQMQHESEFAKRINFTGDPLRKAMQWIEENDWEKVETAFDEIDRRKNYLSKQPEDDVEELMIAYTKKLVTGNGHLLKAKAISALSEASMSIKFVLSMLSREEDKGSAEKRSKLVTKTQKNVFQSESDDEWTRRLVFSLELLSVLKKTPTSPEIFALLFELLKIDDCDYKPEQQQYVHQLTISLLVKMLQSPALCKLSPKDLRVELVVEILRSTQSHQILRDSLRLLTVATKVSPTSVLSHIMSVFTFMGAGLLRKDNELTLGIIEDALQAFFGAVVASSSKAKQDASFNFVEVCRVFALSITDIPAHRRMRLAGAIHKSIPIEYAWIFPTVIYEKYCSSWQRTATPQNEKTRSPDQESFDDFSIEMCSNYNGIEQIRFLLDILAFVMRVGTDLHKEAPNAARTTAKSLDTLIFDRKKHTLPKIRHYRFVLVTLVAKILSNPTIYEKLAVESDESLAASLLPIGRQLLMTSVDVDEFVQKGLDEAEKEFEAESAKRNAQRELEVVSAQRYWIAMGTRTDIVSDKLRHLFPASVSARLISETLNDKKSTFSMKEKALALCNAKLQHDENGINEEQLSSLIEILNGWIGPKKVKEAIVLCQNAAYTLRLIAKRLSTDKQHPSLSTTMQHCVTAIKSWESLDEAMIGSLLLLAGELIRSHNMGTTMLNAEPLLQGCLNVLSTNATSRRDSEEKPPEATPRRRRVRLMSLSGRPKGSDALLVCTLTCVQRIVDKFASFVAPHFTAILLHFSRLSARFVDQITEKDANASLLAASQALPSQQSMALKNTVQYRLGAIRHALLKVEFRVILDPIAQAVQQLKSSEKPLCALFSFLAGFFETRNFQWVFASSQQLIKEIFLPAFEYRSTMRKPEEFEMISRVERSIFDAFLALAEMLNENQLKPIFSKIVSWGEEGFRMNADLTLRIRMVTLFHLANHFYSSFNTLAMPYFHRLIELAAKVLRSCNTILTDSASLFLSGKKDSLESLETDSLLIHAIDFVQNCAKHKEFFTEDRAELVSEHLVAELENTKCAGHEARCVPHLADAIYQVAEAHPVKFANLLHDILLKTRSNKPKIRYRILLFVERLFDRVGDSIAPHLPMVMPFLSELLEDENKNVEEQCDRVVRLLQRKFGAELSQGFLMVADQMDLPRWIPRYDQRKESTIPSMITVLIHPLASTSSVQETKQEGVKTDVNFEGKPKNKAINEFFDPLGVTANDEVDDPLSELLAESSFIETNDSSARKRDVTLVNTLEMRRSDHLCVDVDLPNMEPWRKKRSLILETFTTSDKSSITSSSSFSHSSNGNIVDSAATSRAQVRVIDKTAHRLEILEDMSGLKKLADLSAHEYVQNVNELRETLILAWNNNKRVEALRVVTELSRALSSVSPPSLYPSQWVLVTDVLDLFGSLVYERILNKANEERKATGKPILSPNFTASDVGEKTQDTAKNWFVKVGDIKELVPRFYVESCLIGCIRFFDSPSLRVNLQRLAAMTSRIGQPLPAAYARAYIAKISMYLDPADRAPHWRVLNDWMQTFGQQPSELLWPAAEWIVQCVAYGAHSYEDLGPLWEYCRQSDKRGFILKCFLRAIPPKYLGNHAIEALKIVLADGVTSQEIIALGERLLETEVPEDVRSALLKNVWKAILRLQSTGDLVRCSVVWAEFAARYFSIDELNVICDCLLRRLKTEKCPDKYADSLLAILRSMVGHKKTDTATLLSLDAFTGVLDILRDEPHSSEAARSILSAFIGSHSIGSSEDLRLANQICEIAARLATFLYDNREEETKRTRIVCSALDRFSLSSDPERCLQWLVECRASLAEMDGVVRHIVRLFLTLGLQVQGTHKATAAKANLMRACIANLHITIPSLPSPDDRFNFALQAAHLALYANSLPQTDALVRICIESLMDADIDGAQFVARLNHLLAFLVYVPDSPEKSPLYLFGAVLAVVERRTWDGWTSERGACLVHCLDFLWAAGQPEYPISFPNVHSNDELYGGSAEFKDHLNLLAGEILNRLFPLLMSEERPTIAAMLLEHWIARTDYSADQQSLLLCRRLMQRCRKSADFRKRLSYMIEDLKNERYPGAAQLLETLK